MIASGEPMHLHVKIKLLGVFKKAYGTSQISLEINKKEILKDIIQRVTSASPELRHVLIDRELEDPRTNAIILVNGKEIGLLEGLETEVKAGDEIVFVPVIHGG